jgi:hypothetical protein
MGDRTNLPATDVRENARLELLRCLAWSRDFNREERAKDPVNWSAHDFVPLFCGDFQNTRADMLLAAREAAALGDIELVEGKDVIALLEGPMVQITDQGYDWIKARDVIGEAEQETPRG